MAEICITKLNQMKRLVFSIFFSWVCVIFIWAKPVDLIKAETSAKNFITSHNGFQKNAEIKDISSVKTDRYNEEDRQAMTYFYIFNIKPSGFVIIAGDDCIFPILAYSNEGEFEMKDLPVHVGKWMDMYKKEIAYIIGNQIEATAAISLAWEKLLNINPERASVFAAVDPLVKTKWNQWPYYNALCPGGSPTGCTATAMTQVMKYWNHPDRGSGFHSYNHATYGTLSANFGNTTYLWNQMPNEINSPNNAVATLMYHAGVSVNMGYSPEGSNAHVLSYNGSIPDCAEEALKKYFGYRSSLKGIEKKNYTDAHWVSLMKTELDQGRPILYAGWSQTGGHAFICDGYDNNNYFHFNWGWGGAYDGYFILTTLNPGSGSGFTNYQQMITGIEPIASNQSYSLKLGEKIKINPSPMTFGREFTVKTNIMNGGGGTFNGDFCAAIFDDSWNFIDYVEIKTNLTLTGNSSFASSLVFYNAGLLSMLPGDYFIGIYYKPQGDNQWQWVADNGAFVNFVAHRVYFAADIELYTDLIVTPGINDLVEGENAKVVVNVVNDGFASFKGWYSADLYDLKGSWVANLGMLYESHGLNPGSYYLLPYLQIETQNLDAPPGTYFLALHYKPDGKDWSLAGSSYHANPIYVIVKEADIVPDAYEPNNSLQQAYAFPTNFVNNSVEILTQGSNCHIVNDFDFYEFDLPAGYRYVINARVQDSYNSDDGNEYTADVMFSVSSDGSSWTETFDDDMYQSIPLVGQQRVYFQVVPFFKGERGTYLLQIEIQRFPIVSSEDIQTALAINVYPNPVQDIIQIATIQPDWIQEISLFTAHGQKVALQGISRQNQIINIPVDHVSNGIYLLQLSNGKEQISKKIIICHSE